MIILEGPDGGGKTTLLASLTARGIKQRPRFATSMGPLDNLAHRVYNDFQQAYMQPHRCEVYDRHSLVSEYVYGFALRREVPAQFLWPSSSNMLHEIAKRSLLVLCIPPVETILKSVEQEDQMDGVVANIALIHALYLLVQVWWPNPSGVVLYDWTNPASVDRAMSRINQHNADWNSHV